jgi:hypothetical protein
LQLHGTGTPLGDPIEVGALSAALRGQQLAAARAVPLMPLAGKSWFGHAEPAAGFVGIAHAVAAASHGAALPVLHLRTLNPHVAEAVTGHSAVGGEGEWLLPRTSGCVPVANGACVLTTISAFAFQVLTYYTRSLATCTLFQLHIFSQALYTHAMHVHLDAVLCNKLH